MALDNASLLSQLMERSQMQRVDIFNLQSRNNVFSNTYNSDWSDHSNSMWWEPQNAQQGGYWQPPQPHIQYAQPNLSSSIDYNQKLNELICLVQGSQNQDNEARQEDKRLDHLEKQIGQIAEFVGQFCDQGKLPSSTIVNPKGGFEAPLSEALIAPTPSNSSKVVPISSNPIPPNIPIPCRFMNSKEEESEKDILEDLPKVQSREFHEFIKGDILETTMPKEVEFDDIGQVITITCNLAKSNIPETFKGVVFVIEFLSDKTSFFFQIPLDFILTCYFF